MSAKRLWAPVDGPEEDRTCPHLLWLPDREPQVLSDFARMRELLSRYSDLITPVAAGDEHMTLQKIKKFDRDGRRVNAQRLREAAPVLRDALADRAPIDIAIGPPYTSASAAVLDVSPYDSMHDADALHDFYLRARDGMFAAGLCLPPAEAPLWGHMSGGYGLIDTDTPVSAERSDRLASELSRRLRPGRRIPATLDSVWLVMERQDPVANRYTFTRVCEIPLGPAEGAAA